MELDKLHFTTISRIEEMVTDPPHAILIVGGNKSNIEIASTKILTRIFDVSRLKLKEYPYQMLVEPIKNSIGIEEIRKLREFFLRVVPGTKDIRRFVLVKEAHTLTVPAQNALLKLLEEPPEDAVIILEASEVGKLLPTIRSRCAELRVLPVDKIDIITNFTQLGYKIGAIESAIAAVGSNIDDIKLYLQANSEESSPELQEAKKIIGSSTYERLIILQVYRDRQAAQELCANLAVVARVGLSKSSETGIGISRWTKALQAILDAESSLSKNCNTKLVLTKLMIEM